MVWRSKEATSRSTGFCFVSLNQALFTNSCLLPFVTMTCLPPLKSISSSVSIPESARSYKKDSPCSAVVAVFLTTSSSRHLLL